MRKILLATTAVAGLGLFSTGAVAQPTPEQMRAPMPMALGTASPGVIARLGGYFNFTGYFVQDDADKAVLPLTNGRSLGRRKVDFISDAEFQILIDGIAANGLRYGAVLEFQTDALQGATLGNGTGVNTDEMYGYISGRFGTFRFGDEDAAASLLLVRRPAIIGTDTDGFWDEALAPGSPSVLTGITDGSDATKIIYLSPQFFGFDFGFSYAPNGSEGERPPGNGVRDRTTREDEITISGRYRGNVGNVGIALGAGAVFANNGALQTVTGGTTGNGQNIRGYTAGAQLSAYGASIGGNYQWGQFSGVSNTSSSPALDGARNSHVWSVGATYTIPGIGLQLGTFYGYGTEDINRDAQGRPLGERRQEAYGFGVAYPIAPGLLAYSSYAHFRDKNSPDLIASQRINNGPGRVANVYLAGIRLAF